LKEHWSWAQKNRDKHSGLPQPTRVAVDEAPTSNAPFVWLPHWRQLLQVTDVVEEPVSITSSKDCVGGEGRRWGPIGVVFVIELLKFSVDPIELSWGT